MADKKNDYSTPVSLCIQYTVKSVLIYNTEKCPFYTIIFLKNRLFLFRCPIYIYIKLYRDFI